jgi:hypothetical protein
LTIPIETLHKLLSYDPASGRLFWKERDASMFNGTKAGAHASWNTRWAGEESFLIRSDGYLTGSLLNKKRFAHRVGFAMAHGYWPALAIDHINGVRDDNRISNLREATYGQNARNSRRANDNTSGVKGVSWSSAGKRWIATISVDKTRIHLGRFISKDDAVAAYVRANAELHGEFGRLE